MDTQEIKIDRTNAAIFGFGGNTNISDVVSGILQVKFNDQELQAILTVVGIVLRAAGLQGLQDFVALLVRLEQQFVAGKTAAPAAPAANTASK